MPKRLAPRLFAALALFTFSPGPALGGEPIPGDFDGERAKQYVVHLASNELEGRQSCTAGYREAAEWVAARFEAWGLKPAGEQGTYFQEVTIRDFDWDTGVPRLTLAGRDFPWDDGDFSVHRVSTTGTTVDGEIVFAGYGISAPCKGLDEYAGLEVEGKVVLALRGSPHDAPEPRRTFAGGSSEEKKPKGEDPWGEEATDETKLRTAHEKGAAAILLYDPTANDAGGSRRVPSVQAGDFKPEEDKAFLCFRVGERVFRAIMKQDPQESPRGFRRRIDTMRREIRDGESRSAPTGVPISVRGYDSSVRYDEENGNNTARNILAKIEGTDPKLKDEYVIIGAHLDHVGIRDGYIRNGADDNASGSAVVMEVARILSEGGFKPKRTLIFACWCGEELGLIGSRHYVRSPVDGVSVDRVVTYFNLDMVGLGDSLGAPGALNFPSVWDIIQRDQDPEFMKKIEPSEGGPGGSDHSPFIVRGIEALALMSRGGQGHPDYHQPEDDADKIDPEMLRITGQFVLHGVMNLANESETPLLIPERMHLYRAQRARIVNVNPDLEGSTWQYVTIEEDGRDALEDRLLDQAAAVVRKQAGRSGQSSSSNASSAIPKKSITRGIQDFGMFEGDVRLLELASDFYGFGRIDIQGDDGSWIVEGELTTAGRKALRKVEEAGITVRLVSPDEELLNDFLSAASKPFVVTGDYAITDSMADRIASKGVLLGVDLDPSEVEPCVARLEALKDLVGRRDLLFVFPSSTEGLEEARRPLYLGLQEKGWAYREISGGRSQTSGVLGGNLRALTP
jgi:hypothetical protein